MKTLLPKPAYAGGSHDVPLLDETVGANLRRTAAAHASREALVECATGRRWTYAEFDRAVDEVARALLARGVRRGDRVGLWAPGSAEWVLLRYAAARVGAVLVAVDPACGADALEDVLRRSGTTLLVACARYTGLRRALLAERMRARCPGLRHVLLVGDESWRRALAAGADLPPGVLAEREAAVSPSDPVAIQYAAGPGGPGGGVTLSHHNIVNNGLFAGERLGYTERDRICLPVPPHHGFGTVLGLGATSRGACVILPALSFDAEAVLRAVERERATSLHGDPAMFAAELDVLARGARYDLSSLRTGVITGTPSSERVLRQVVRAMRLAEVSIAYGTPESSPVATGSGGGDPAGRVLPHTEVKIVDPATGRTVECGQPGELCARGCSVMLGYWDEPERTARAVDQAGWLHTGDLAVMRADGCVRVVGRVKDMIVRGGERIHPGEIEELLHTHPKIADAQVVGVPDAKYGEEVLACVVLRDDGETLSAEELSRFCEDRLAGSRVPRYVRVVNGFPTAPAGGVRRVHLREWAAGDLALLG